MSQWQRPDTKSFEMEPIEITDDENEEEERTVTASADIHVHPRYSVTPPVLEAEPTESKEEKGIEKENVHQEENYNKPIIIYTELEKTDVKNDQSDPECEGNNTCVKSIKIEKDDSEEDIIDQDELYDRPILPYISLVTAELKEEDIEHHGGAILPYLKIDTGDHKDETIDPEKTDDGTIMPFLKKEAMSPKNENKDDGPIVKYLRIKKASLLHDNIDPDLIDDEPICKYMKLEGVGPKEEDILDEGPSVKYSEIEKAEADDKESIEPKGADEDPSVKEMGEEPTDDDQKVSFGLFE